LTLLANLAQHTTAITVLAGLPFTPTNLTSHGLHVVGTSTSTDYRSTPQSITTDKIRLHLRRSTDREMNQKAIFCIHKSPPLVSIFSHLIPV